MRGLWTSISAASALAIVSACVATTPADRPPGPSRRLDGPDAATRDAARRRAPIGGVNAATTYERAAAARAVMPRFASRIGRTLPYAQVNARAWMTEASGVLDAWTPLGPGNIGGRTRVIRYHPANANIIFAAGVSDGVWRSDDSGTSWRPIADGLANLTVNVLVIDPRNPDTMFAGTGEGYFREDIRGTGLPLRGSGIFVTRDGGATWQRLTSTANDDFLWVNDLELGIGDTRRLYAATRTGVWRSTNSGDTWTRLLTTDVRGGCLDLAMRADQQDDLLFASCGTYEQATVYRFTRASGGDPPEVVLKEPGMGRTSLAIAPSNPDIIYAMAASNDPGPDGNYRQGLQAVYRSDRGGAAGTWQPRVTNVDPARLNTLLLTNLSAATAEECGAPAGANEIINMGWYSNVIAVDPRDPDRVWAAGVDWYRSDDGGRSWGVALVGAHVDQHAIIFHPAYDGQGNQTVIIGNDGGLYRTANARGRTSTGPRVGCPASRATIEVRWTLLNRDYGVTQFYYGLPYQNGTRYLGGAQDNSTLIGSDQAGSNAWTTVLGGDGGYVAVDPANPLLIYAESQWANIARSTDGGTRWTSTIRGLDEVRSDNLGPDANYLFVAPFVMDPANPSRLWLGGDHLYRTTDGAVQWTKASTAMPDSGLVSTIAIAASDPNRMAAGTHNGYIVSSRNALSAGASTNWSGSRAREGWVTSVAFDSRDTNIVYATYGNFGGAHVYRSADGGGTWDSLDGDDSQRLPDIPAHSIVIDPDDPARIYLGTDLGVFVSVEGGRRWLVEETGFGPAVTEWLALMRDTSGRKRLFAFTHGRGVWRVDIR